MSTPAAKPVGPIDLTSYVSQRARKRTESQPTEGDNQSVGSPYAPKQSRERTDITRRVTDAPRTDAPRTDAPRADAPRADAPRTPLFPDVPTPEPAVDLDVAAHRVAPGSDPPRRTAERPQQAFTEHDSERLEASLRWLQREEAATRLLHGQPAAHAPAEAGEQDDIDDRPPRRFQSLRSLEPEHLVPPAG